MSQDDDVWDSWASIDFTFYAWMEEKQKTLLYVFHRVSVYKNLKHFAGSTPCNWKKKEDYGRLTRSLKAVSLNLWWAFEMKLSGFQSGLCSPPCSRPAGVRGLLEDGVQRGEPPILAGLRGLQESSQRDGKGRGCQKDLRGVCRSRRAQTGTAFVKRKWELHSSQIHLSCSLSRSLSHSFTHLLCRNTTSTLLFSDAHLFLPFCYLNTQLTFWGMIM